MMDDDKKTPEGFDDSFDEHELDLNTPEELNPVEDITFADTTTESTSMFDEFDDSNTFSELQESSTEKPASTEEPNFEIPAFDEHEFGKHEFDEPLFEDTSFGDTASKSSQEMSHDDFSFEESFEPASERPDNLATDEDMFASDAFEDVNADFPEGEAGKNLGDSQLFDYDPNAATTEGIEESEEMYDTPMAGPGGPGGKDKGPKGPGLGNVFKNRRALRVAVLLVLIGVVYGGLRLFTGGDQNTMTNVTAPKEVAHPASVPTIANAPMPEQPAEQTPSPMPELAATPEATPPSTEAAPATAATPAPTETAAPQVAATAPTPAPAPVSALNQQPQTSLQVPAPGTATTIAGNAAMIPVAPAPSGGTQPDQIAHKLDSLEASIAAIDNRLATISSHGGTTGVRGAQPAGPGNAFGKAEPESQEILMQALHKIDGIDKKMSYISELETQVHILNKEVSALKNDVVQQSIIVGQNQAHINQNLIAAIDANAPKMIVQAAIPGRAWLRSETGQLITVIPGDEVAGYGRVVSIDPSTGTVTMSSRAVFREQ